MSLSFSSLIGVRSRERGELNGIIYLHDISQAHIAASKDEIEIFNKLSHPGTDNNIIFALTKWSQVSDSVGREREQQLSRLYCSGQKVARFENTPKSAWDIVTLTLTNESIHVSQIHDELAKFQKGLATKPRRHREVKGFFTFLFGRSRAVSPPHPSIP